MTEVLRVLVILFYTLVSLQSYQADGDKPDFY